jgi:hypothetical protein
MRASLAFSAVGHVALLLWGMVLFASPKQFAPIPPESILVDIVPVAAMGQDASASPPAERAAAQQRRSDPQQSRPDPGQESSASAQPPAQERREAGETRPPAAEPAPSLMVFNPTVAPVPELPLTSGGTQNPTGGFDAPAEGAAALSREEIAALKAHLQKCWNPPPAIADAPKLRIVLRVAFTRGGSLTGSPMLLEASASAHGPALVATATSALKQCQPYSFLPAAKYQEWKLLDLSFSPRGLMGG